MNWVEVFQRYIISFFLSTLLFIYMLKLPNVITNQRELINQYYYGKNTMKMLLLDFVLIALYFSISIKIYNFFEVKTLWIKVLIVSITTFLLSHFFYRIFLSRPLNNKSFFSQWFYKSGIRAVIYDVIFLTILFIIFETSKF